MYIFRFFNTSQWCWSQRNGMPLFVFFVSKMGARLKMLHNLYCGINNTKIVHNKEFATCVWRNNLFWTLKNLAPSATWYKKHQSWTTTSINTRHKRQKNNLQVFLNVLKFCDVKSHHICTYFGYSCLLRDAGGKVIGCRSLYFFYQKWAQVFKYSRKSLLRS